jgi:hypothetical protein
MTTAHPQATAPKSVPFEQIAAVNQQTLAAAAKANARMMHEMLAVQRRLLDFAARRIERDMDTAKRLVECSDAPEMAILAQTFCAQAVTDYAAEATELMQIAAKAGADAARQAPNGKAPAA